MENKRIEVTIKFGLSGHSKFLDCFFEDDKVEELQAYIAKNYSVDADDQLLYDETGTLIERHHLFSEVIQELEKNEMSQTSRGANNYLGKNAG